jgi:hypothetical protein
MLFFVPLESEAELIELLRDVDSSFLARACPA